MRIIIILAISFLMAHTVFGQNDATSINNNLTIQTGFSYLSLKDQIFSPIFGRIVEYLKWVIGVIGCGFLS